jgi:phage terminase large subunit
LICTIKVDKKISTGKEIENDLKQLMIKDGVPRSGTIADSDGLGAYLESYLTGIKEFHGGSSAINKIEFVNLKSECAYKLAEFVNKRQIKIICTLEQRERITQEMGALKARSVTDDEKRKGIVKKDDMKEQLNRSPDYLDMLLMNMVFYVQHQRDWIVA